jgi:hypothetical protein
VQLPAHLAIVCSLVTLLVAPVSAQAFLTPGKTRGTEISLLPLGPGLWQLTVESGDPAVNNGGSFGIQNAVSFDPNLAICGNDFAICGAVQGADVGLAGTLFLVVAIDRGNLAAGVGNPQTLGTVRDNGLLPKFDPVGICYITTGDCPGFANPVTFSNPIPEPGSGALLAAALALVALRLSAGRWG